MRLPAFVCLASLLWLACPEGKRSCFEGCRINEYCDAATQLCVVGVAPDAGGSGGGSGGTGGGGGLPAECTPGAERSCPGGCNNVQTCLSTSRFGPCLSKCPTGNECVQNACVCTPRVCSGCCDGNACKLGNEDARCGTAGLACAACPAGQQCLPGGRCVGCNATSCPDGCCAAVTCLAPTLDTCGLAGSSCTACNAERADSCANGACRCGASGPCAVGQRCEGGQCVCNARSCPDGCCNGNTCNPASTATCGADGGACVACDVTRADRCAAGGCACGAAAQPCEVGQACVAGACVCNGASCPNGCCNGATCNPQSLANCGTDGGACGLCSTATADQCAGGACRCGNNPACGAGTRCANGQCVCDSFSCTGCCNGAQCLQPSLENCGLGGQACTVCSATRSNFCLSGQCQCGFSPQCPVGQACVSNACQ